MILAKVLSISGNTYDWNEKSGKSGDDVGVIAQEVLEVLPQAVTTRDNGYPAVDYQRIVPLLVEAVKELSARVQDLEQKNYQINNSKFIIMANFRKSFNFRNGVQVDDDNFVVNPNGLVGIGTSIPSEFLDVRGTAKFVGLTTIKNAFFVEDVYIAGVGTFKGNVEVGITSIQDNGIVTATSPSGIVTYFGDGGELLNTYISMGGCRSWFWIYFHICCWICRHRYNDAI